MALIGDLVVKLRADTKGLVAGLNTAKFQVAKMRSSFNSVAKSVAGLTTAIVGLAGAGGLGMLIKSSFQSIDVLAKEAKKINISTEALAGLQLAAREAGATSEGLSKGLEQMVRRVSEAATGTGEAKDALHELGLSAMFLNQFTPDKQFMAIAGAMEKVENHADKVRLAYEIFGRQGMELVNTLALGKAGLEETAQAARDLNLAISAADAAKIELANDSVGRMRDAIKGMSNEIAIGIAPFVTQIAKDFTEAASGAESFRKIGEGIARAFAKVGDIVVAMKLGYLKLEEIVLRMLAAIGDAMQWISNKLIDILNALPGIEGLKYGDQGAGWAKRMRTMADISAEDFNKLLIAKTPSERLAAQMENMKNAEAAAPKTTSIQQLAIADQIGRSMGEWIAKASGKAANVTQAGIASAVGAVTALGTGAGNRAVTQQANRAIDAATAEGYAALRANMRGDPQKEIRDLNKKQLDELMKGNTLSQKLVDLIGKGVDLISIPAA